MDDFVLSFNGLGPTVETSEYGEGKNLTVVYDPNTNSTSKNGSSSGDYFFWSTGYIPGENTLFNIRYFYIVLTKHINIVSNKIGLIIAQCS
jgi:hypothetical protein